MPHVIHPQMNFKAISRFSVRNTPNTSIIHKNIQTLFFCNKKRDITTASLPLPTGNEALIHKNQSFNAERSCASRELY